LPTFVAKLGCKTRGVYPRGTLPHRVAGKLYSAVKRWPQRSHPHAAAELQFALCSRVKRWDVKHVLYVEDHLLFFDQWRKAPQNIICTIHLPRAVWNNEMLMGLTRLSSAIVLYHRDREFFESFVGPERVRFIHYGVSTDFFRPRPDNIVSERRLLSVGHYLRNVGMLSRVIRRLSHRHPDLAFDIVVPERFVKTAGFSELLKMPRVHWYQALTDEELRYLYQRSYLLLLPMDYVGASNAIVEALACGLPIVSTGVGGISDYGGGDIYPTVDNNDDDGMIELVEKYLNAEDWREAVARRCRTFAETELSWPRVAQEHLDAYSALAW
jgi:glycosyltransferase involved in cell wall biosynthesis